MRQYRILYKRLGGKFTTLEPFTSAAIYDKPEVREAIDLMRTRPALVATCVQLDSDLFNIVSFEQEAFAPQAFRFEDVIPAPA